MANWIIDRTINFNAETKTGLNKTTELLRLLLEEPKKSNSEIEHILFQKGILPKDNDKNNPLQRRWFTYLKSYCLYNNDTVTELGKLYATGKLKMNEAALLSLMSKRELNKVSEKNICLLKNLFLAFKPLILTSKFESYVTKQEFTSLICNISSNDNDEIYNVGNKILELRKKGVNVSNNDSIKNYDIWFNALETTGIFEKINDSLYVKDFEILNYIIQFFEMNTDFNITPGNFENEFIKFIKPLKKGLFTFNLKKLLSINKYSNIIYDFLFEDYDLRKITEKYANKNGNNWFEQILEFANLDVSNLGIYKYFKNFENIIFNTMQLSEDNEIRELGELMMKNNVQKEIVETNIHDTVRGGCNKIYYGAPGCGKSYYVKKFLQDANVSNANQIRVTFHPEYSNTDFIGQILPCIENYVDENDGLQKEKITYSFRPGPFSIAIKRASETKEMVYLIIEEINRGNAAAIFGDLFQLLDRKGSDDEFYGESETPICNPTIQRYLGVGSGNELKIPSNLTILATMNSSDQNVFTLDTAFKRRWLFEQLSNNILEDKSHAYKNWKIPGTNVTWATFVTKLNEEILSFGLENQTNEDKRLGKYFVSKDCLTENHESLENEDIKIKAKEFAFKVLEYIWNDVCKFEKGQWFDLAKYRTLEDLIEGFLNPNIEEGETPLTIFRKINF